MLMCVHAQSCPTLCDPMDCSHQASRSMGSPRQEHWTGLPFPSPGDLPNPGIKPGSPALQVDSLLSEPPGKPLKALCARAHTHTHTHTHTPNKTLWKRPNLQIVRNISSWQRGGADCGVRIKEGRWGFLGQWKHSVWDCSDECMRAKSPRPCPTLCGAVCPDPRMPSSQSEPWCELGSLGGDSVPAQAHQL